MNHSKSILLPLLALTLVLSGCDLLEGILKLGFWSGVVFVLLLLGVIWFVARLFRR